MISMFIPPRLGWGWGGNDVKIESMPTTLTLLCVTTPLWEPNLTGDGVDAPVAEDNGEANLMFGNVLAAAEDAGIVPLGMSVTGFIRPVLGSLAMIVIGLAGAAAAGVDPPARKCVPNPGAGFLGRLTRLPPFGSINVLKRGKTFTSFYKIKTAFDVLGRNDANFASRRLVACLNLRSAWGGIQCVPGNCSLCSA